METLTIDNKKTKSRDDAVSWQFNDNHKKLFVHITDPSILVKPDSIFDKDAKEKVMKVDIGDFHMPMLPPFITYQLGSLNKK